MASAPGQKGPGRLSLSAQQKARALGAVEPLVARHGRVGRPPAAALSVLPLREAPETLADRLAEHGVAVRAGLHCAPLAHRTAGTEETGTLRFSASIFNTPEEAETVLRML